MCSLRQHQILTVKEDQSIHFEHYFRKLYWLLGARCKWFEVVDSSGLGLGHPPYQRRRRRLQSLRLVYSNGYLTKFHVSSFPFPTSYYLDATLLLLKALTKYFHQYEQILIQLLLEHRPFLFLSMVYGKYLGTISFIISRHLLQHSSMCAPFMQGSSLCHFCPGPFLNFRIRYNKEWLFSSGNEVSFCVINHRILSFPI